jgi:osmotically inducible lipoprotein OsmB
MRKMLLGTVALTLLGAAGCENLSARENEVLRDAGIGAAAGAVIGGVTGNNPVTGAIVGGAVGGAYGAYETRND